MEQEILHILKGRFAFLNNVYKLHLSDFLFKDKVFNTNINFLQSYNISQITQNVFPIF